MSRAIYNNAGRIPREIDVVVGIPRSGMLPANVIALALDRPLAALDDFLAGRILQSGRRRPLEDTCMDPLTQRILLVDDAVSTGAALNEARQKVYSAIPRENVTILCVYGATDAPALADIVLETVDRPMMFEWNFMHHPHLKNCCVDIDGVICRDALLEEDDDGPNYARFLAEAHPLIIPSKKIGWLVTSRLSKYRRETEDWLVKHGVDYGELIMLDLPDAATRRRMAGSGIHKGEVYKKLRGSKLFIESSRKDARRIAHVSGKPVLDFGSLCIVRPAPFSGSGLRQRAENALRRNFHALKRSFRPTVANHP